MYTCLVSAVADHFHQYEDESTVSHSKIDKTKVFMTIGSLMKVISITECSPWSILQYTFDLHYAIIGLENHF